MLQLDLSVLLSHPPGDQLFYLETRISVVVYCCHGSFLDALHICKRKVCVMLFVVRELAIQIHNEARKFAQGSMIKSVVASSTRLVNFRGVATSLWRLRAGPMFSHIGCLFVNVNDVFISVLALFFMTKQLSDV